MTAYILEWNLGSFPSNDWNEIINHPYFSIGTAYELTPVGWCAV